MIRAHGYEHPLGDDWRGFHDIDPSSLTRERVLEMLARSDPSRSSTSFRTAHRARSPAGCRVLDAGLRVPKILDYGGMAGVEYAHALRRPGPRGRGRAAAPWGRAVTRVLDANELLADAQAATGLADWGDATFPDRFRSRST